MIIRRAQSSFDWKAIREICCLTGYGGDPIDRSRWDLFAEIWVGPYQKMWPTWTWVCEDQGQVVGYLTGCPNSEEHARRRLKEHALVLMTRFWRYRFNSDAKRFLKRTLGLEKGPEESFGAEFTSALNRSHPAHLHMNFRETVRGGGWGRKIVEVFIEEMRHHAIKGVHLYCGEKARGFYLKVGFEDLKKIEFKPGVWVYCLGKKIL